jgi:hypothetical protein
MIWVVIAVFGTTLVIGFLQWLSGWKERAREIEFYKELNERRERANSR